MAAISHASRGARLFLLIFRQPLADASRRRRDRILCQLLLGEFEAAFDPIETIVHSVEPHVESSHVGLDAGDVLFDRRQAQALFALLIADRR